MCNHPVRMSIVIAMLAFALASCATMFPGAQSEFDLGMQFFNQGRYADAIPHFQRASEHDPNFADAFLYLGRCYVSTGRYVEAIQPLRTAYSLAPEKTRRETFTILLDALIGAALSEVKRGDLRSAVGHFKDALALDPQSRQAKDELAKALISYGGQLLLRGDFRGAVDSYREALSYSPNSIGAYLGLARAFLQRGDLKQSLEALQGARRIDSENTEVLDLLRDLLVK